MSTVIYEQLRLVAQLGSELLALSSGNIGSLINRIGFSHFAPHINTERVKHWFEGLKKCPNLDRLLGTLEPGARIDVRNTTDGLVALE